VGISDAQAIINMIFDAFLMRQQFNSHDSFMIVSACLRSRTRSNNRMLRRLVETGRTGQLDRAQHYNSKQHDFASKLPSEDLFGRVCTSVSYWFGHIITLFGYWVGIFLWIGFGHYCHWSSRWQLYINTATSALMVFILAFLANIRERHSNYSEACLKSIYEVDATLELRLRHATDDEIDNEPINIPAPQRTRIQRVIDYYADLVGTLVGIAILFLVIVVWVVIGPAMSFGSNWWLLIGTYAGLVGMNDGFVLRNVYHVLRGYEDTAIDQITHDDMDMLAVVSIPQIEDEYMPDNSLSCRISLTVGNFCSHQLTVVVGGVLIIGLIVGASAMGWSVTGQLLCNVPPSIIESFFMMILITGHNVSDAKRRVDLQNIYVRRLKLLAYVNAVVNFEKSCQVPAC